MKTKISESGTYYGERASARGMDKESIVAGNTRSGLCRGLKPKKRTIGEDVTSWKRNLLEKKEPHKRRIGKKERSDFRENPLEN